MKSLNLRSKRFGRWLVIGRTDNVGKKAAWQCQCDCGTVRIVTTSNLTSGKSKSCGCFHADAITTHQLSRTLEYRTWQSIKQRCYNPNHIEYRAYGGRGITVCERWIECFENFFSDMGLKPSPQHSIERINVNGSYSPENCRWATHAEQVSNMRSNRLLIHNGRTQTVAQWAREIGHSKTGLLYRLNAGWSITDSLTKPSSRGSKN